MQKYNVKRYISVMLCAVLCFALSSCASDEGKELLSFGGYEYPKAVEYLNVRAEWDLSDIYEATDLKTLVINVGKECEDELNLNYLAGVSNTFSNLVINITSGSGRTVDLSALSKVYCSIEINSSVKVAKIIGPSVAVESFRVKTEMVNEIDLGDVSTCGEVKINSSSVPRMITLPMNCTNVEITSNHTVEKIVISGGDIGSMRVKTGSVQNLDMGDVMSVNELALESTYGIIKAALPARTGNVSYTAPTAQLEFSLSGEECGDLQLHFRSVIGKVDLSDVKKSGIVSIMNDEEILSLYLPQDTAELAYYGKAKMLGYIETGRLGAISYDSGSGLCFRAYGTSENGEHYFSGKWWHYDVMETMKYENMELYMVNGTAFSSSHVENVKNLYIKDGMLTTLSFVNSMSKLEYVELTLVEEGVFAKLFGYADKLIPAEDASVLEGAMQYTGCGPLMDFISGGGKLKLRLLPESEF